MFSPNIFFSAIALVTLALCRPGKSSNYQNSPHSYVDREYNLVLGSLCEGATLLSAETVPRPSGVSLNLTRWACPQTSLKRSPVPVAFARDNTLVKRPASQCTEPQECLCGQTCTSVCTSGAGAVNPADCDTLADELLDTGKSSWYLMFSKQNV
ncbi:hypothetical protein SISSUDRAFT_181282 [Sistotremastrum suecicum HHB10207 ss-3]|uniref:WAP domain-containing protein n=1 Tax=Sistotremastrum suecicum HHB10207 ss-3 TaxID=1314776 RepID=A0A166GSB4_9AGAM|nr:hypothetical protein SISSUDRAFT_181282 [Sistotremastrum suecicum HHB10207 ss-3]